MSRNLAKIDVDVPAAVAYDQWTFLQMFPAFMDDVEAVTKIEDGRHRWTTKIAGVRREFESEVVDAVPAERIAWSSVDGLQHEGSVTFEPVDDEHTTITICLDLEPSSTLEQMADSLGMVRRRMQTSLEEFKQNVEARPTGTELNASYDMHG